MSTILWTDCPHDAGLYETQVCPSAGMVNMKVTVTKLTEILTWSEILWKTLKVILLQEGSGMGHSQTVHGLFFISDLRL